MQEQKSNTCCTVSKHHVIMPVTGSFRLSFPHSFPQPMLLKYNQKAEFPTTCGKVLLYGMQPGKI